MAQTYIASANMDGAPALRPSVVLSYIWLLQCLFLIAALSVTSARAESEPTNLPLISIDHFTYVGAFRVPENTGSEVSNMNYSLGRIAYNPDRHSVYITGHNQHQALIEFAVPELVASNKIDELNFATILQNFSTVLDRAASNDPERPDRITGMQYIHGPNGPELLINVGVYYTGSILTETTLVVRDPSNLANSVIDGYFELEGRELAAGWISPVPSEWHNAIGGRYLTGHANNLSNRSRLSVGPSVYVFDPFHIVGNTSVPRPVPTVALQVFPDRDGQKLHDDPYNTSGQNGLWTELSRVHYGLIVPGTRTLFTIGRSGGHNPADGFSGVCYKDHAAPDYPCPPGVTWGGPGPTDPEDWYQFYWLWDVNNLLAVKAGKASPHEARPYARGVFPSPPEFQGRRYNKKIGGGSFDPKSGRLYLVSTEPEQPGTYDTSPIVLVYEVNSDRGLGRIPMPPTDVRVDR